MGPQTTLEGYGMEPDFVFMDWFGFFFPPLAAVPLSCRGLPNNPLRVRRGPRFRFYGIVLVFFQPLGSSSLELSKHMACILLICFSFGGLILSIPLEVQSLR